MRLEPGEKGQFAATKLESRDDSKTVCFKHLRYEVSESSGYVTITVEKKIPEDFTFWLRTVDGTAKAGEDYEQKDECMTMGVKEKEREIKIMIHDDPDWEPDEEFTVELLDELNQKRLPGRDTQCTVLIQDEDKPGSIGFPETFISVRRKDQTAYITVHRTNGSDGEIQCTMNTICDVELLPGKKAATEYKDFVPIKNMPIVFKSGVVEETI